MDSSDDIDIFYQWIDSPYDFLYVIRSVVIDHTGSVFVNRHFYRVQPGRCPVPKAEKPALVIERVNQYRIGNFLFDISFRINHYLMRMLYHM